MNTTDPVIARGSIAFVKKGIDPSTISRLRRRLTLVSTPYKDQEPQTVRGFEETPTELFIPRHFATETYWPQVTKWEWTVPSIGVHLQSKMQLDPGRGQVQAVQALESHLRDRSGGILIAPTGQGKTLIGLSTAQRFKTPIGVMIYAAHMIDNWVEHAVNHFGLRPQDIGFVQEDRCDLGRPLTIMSVQSLLARRYPDALYNQIGFLIADEVHRYGASQWSRVFGAFPGRYRLGMSADPVRTDGLDQAVFWTFGDTAYRLRKKADAERATVCFYRYPAHYSERSYTAFKRDEDNHWVAGDPDNMKYDRILMGDGQRNAWVVDQVLSARSKGRSILVFSKRRQHCQALHDTFVKLIESSSEPVVKNTKAVLMLGGATTKKQRAAQSAALKADVMFATYGYAKDAMNAIQLDTLVFATPPGNPLQPIGRLRDIPTEGKKSLLVVDIYEPNDYSTKRMSYRESLYQSLKHPIKWFGRDVR